MAAIAVGLLGAGCSDQKKNELRVPNPVESTVKVTDEKVVVSPSRFDYGQGAGLAQPQNAVEAQAEARGETVTAQTQTAPPTSADQPMILTIANLSTHDVSLVIHGPVDATSDRIAAGETGRLKVSLRTGRYRVSAAGIRGAAPGTIDIGPARASAQNDLLLP
jgi:hypothetical protein